MEERFHSFISPQTARKQTDKSSLRGGEEEQRDSDQTSSCRSAAISVPPAQEGDCLSRGTLVLEDLSQNLKTQEDRQKDTLQPLSEPP